MVSGYFWWWPLSLIVLDHLCISSPYKANNLLASHILLDNNESSGLLQLLDSLPDMLCVSNVQYSLKRKFNYFHCHFSEIFSCY